MPAMPMAESSAPMVVGMSVTKQGDEHDDRDGTAGVGGNGSSGSTTVASRKISVMPARRMLSAISLGVF